MRAHLVLLAVAIITLVLVTFLVMRRETWSNYPGDNEFMEVYYDQVAEDPAFIMKFPYWGTGTKAGLRCRKPNNVGCDTMWLSSQLVEITPELKKKLECFYGIPFKKILTNIR